MTATSRAIFAESGHFTAMHNALFDWVQPRLSLSAWSVLCVIVRRTRGWGKKYDAISYQQIMAATGIKSTATISKALNELLSDSPFGKPLLRRQRSSERTASCREATRYALNPRFEILETCSRRGEEEGGEEENFLTAEAQRRGEFGGEESQSLSALSSTVPVASPSLLFSSAPLLDAPLLESGGLEIEGREEVGALNFEASEGVRPLKDEETKETPGCYEVENSRCVDAHTANSSSSSTVSSSLLAAVCAATLRDPAVVSAKMRGQLVACAHRLERAGYSREEIERAASRWPYPTAPTPAQLLDNIAALLGARPCHTPSDRTPPQPHRAKPSNPAAPTGATTSDVPAARSGGGEADRSSSRFEGAAQRKSRKWASWLAELGDACCR